MKAIILASGKGTRMNPLGETTPKLLTPIFNKALVYRFFEILEDFEEIIFIISGDSYGEKIKDFINKISTKQKVSFAIQKDVNGTATAILYAKSFFKIGERFLILNGDDIYAKSDIKRLLNEEFAVMGQKVSDPEKWGIFHTHEKGCLEKLIEKPQEFVGDIANIGLYLVDYRIFDIAEKIELSPRGEYELPDAINIFAQEAKVKVLSVEKYWIPVGYPWHIFDAHEKLIQEIDFKIEGIIEGNTKVNGKLKLGNNSIIKSGCVLKGDIIIGDNVIIEENCKLFGNIVIGNDVKIDKNCLIENSIIFNNTILEQNISLKYSIIGKNSKLKKNIITKYENTDSSNIFVNVKGKMTDSGRKKLGAIIGENVIISEDTIIYPGVKIGTNINTLPNEIVKEDKI